MSPLLAATLWERGNEERGRGGTEPGIRPRVVATTKGTSMDIVKLLRLPSSIDVLGAGDDLMTNASKSGCLPEQIAYWDAALEPAQVAWIFRRKKGECRQI